MEVSKEPGLQKYSMCLCSFPSHYHKLAIKLLIFEIKNLQDSLLGLLKLQSSLFRTAGYLLLNEAVMQLLL